MKDGTLVGGDSGQLYRVVRPRWYQVGRRLALAWWLLTGKQKVIRVSSNSWGAKDYAVLAPDVRIPGVPSPTAICRTYWGADDEPSGDE